MLFRSKEGEGVFAGEIGTDCARFVEGEAIGECYGWHFAPWVTGEVVFGLDEVVLAYWISAGMGVGYLLFAFGKVK